MVHKKSTYVILQTYYDRDIGADVEEFHTVLLGPESLTLSELEDEFCKSIGVITFEEARTSGMTLPEYMALKEEQVEGWEVDEGLYIWKFVEWLVENHDFEEVDWIAHCVEG